MKKFAIILLLMVLFNGCEEIIDSTGILLNRLRNNEAVNKDITVSVLNTYGKFVPGFRISVLSDSDSLLLFYPKNTNSGSPVVFNLPDEQVNPFKKETMNIIIYAEHPYIGMFQQIIPVSNLYDNELLIIEFLPGYSSDTLTVAPSYLYRHFNN